MMMAGVRVEDIDTHWRDIEPHLEKTLATDPRGYYQAGDVRKFLKERAMQLWVGYDGEKFVFFQVTQIINYPQKRVCQFMWSGGNIYPELQAHLNVVEDWAAANGCHSYETFGRKGWSKVVQGYELLYWMAYKYAKNQ